MTQAGLQIFQYSTDYFDSNESQCYLDHHNQRTNRLKLRSRAYVDSGQKFVECKIKSNKDVTHKLREKVELATDNQSITETLKDLSNLQGLDLKPVLNVSYQRITLMHRGKNQRVTLDLRPNFRSLVDQNYEVLNRVAVVEIKQNQHFTSTALQKVLHQKGYRSVDFSKFCVGQVLVSDSPLKYNRFKSKLTLLSRLEGRKLGVARR